MKNNKSSFPLFLICLLLISILIITFSLGKNLLGGEGNYFLNFSKVSSFYRYSWQELMSGTGFSNPIINFTFLIFDFFSQLEKIGLSQSQMTIFKLSFLYLLPFSSVYWLSSKVLKNKKIISFFVSFFYILNPFSAYHIQGMMFWNVAPLFIWPLFFGIIYKNYYNWKKLFFIFGLCSSVLAFSFANIPYFGIFQIFLVFSILTISIILDKKIIFSKFLKLFLVLEISFILFNSWWFINLIRFQLSERASFYPTDFAINWAKSTSDSSSILSRIFSIRTQMPFTNSEFYYFTNFYNHPLILLILFIPFFLLILSLINNKKQNSLLIFISFFILIVFFLNKGSLPPAGWLYLLFLEKIPFFIIFKSPLEKFSPFLVFIYAISLPYLLKNINNKIYIPLFSLYLFACAIPFISMQFFPDFPIGVGQYVSRTFVDKEEYKFIRNKINSEKIYYRLFSLPGSLNYQITMLNQKGKYYRGLDPLMYSINKPYIAAYSGVKFNSLFENFSNEKYVNLMSLYGIKYILINKDIYPSFGFKENLKIDELETIFGISMKEIRNGSLILFKNTIFLPHFYTPQSTIISNQSIDSLPNIVFQPDFKIRSSIYFESQNKDKISEIKELLSIDKDQSTVVNSEPLSDNNPKLEFRKINSTKYRIKVHQAKVIFPIVFSESYHEGWKLYIKKDNKIADLKVDRIKDYKILDGNEDDQADKEELQGFINYGWISTLGDGKKRAIKHLKYENGMEKLDYIEKYNIDFVSKNFQDSIQNDNLQTGVFWESWMPNKINGSRINKLMALNKNVLQIPDKNHLMVNGYANSWIIDTDVICKDKEFCNKNEDGSYDMELIVEFWPQRLFYIGLGISSTTFICSLSYLTWTWIRKRSRKVS